MKKIVVFSLLMVIVLVGMSIVNENAYTQEGTIVYPKMPNVGQLVEQSDVIVIGQATQVTSQWDTNSYGDEIITSDVQFTIEEVLKGAEEIGKTINFTGLEGGAVGDMVMESSSTPLYVQNERSVLFLENSTGNLHVIGGDFGKYDIDAFDNIPEIGESLTYFRTQILSFISGSRIFLPIIIKPHNSNDSPNSNNLLNDTDSLKVLTPQYVETGQRWPGDWPVVGFSINNPGFNDSGVGTIAQQNNAIINGATSWREQSRAHFSYQYDGTTSVSIAANDGINVVIVRNASSGTRLATATWWFNLATGEILDCDIVFWDQNFSFSVSGIPGPADIQTVALHEFGHCLGLGHPPLMTAIMFESYLGTQRQLSLDDIAGIRHIYGVGSGSIWANGMGHGDGWLVENHPRMMADVNADGREDIIAFGAAGVWVATAKDTEDGFNSPSIWTTGFSYNDGWRVENHPRMMADVNDDDRADVVGFGAAGVWVATAKETGDGFNSPSIWTTGFSYNDGWRVEDHPRMMADVNDDDRTDAIGFGADGVWVATAKDTGDGFNSPSIWTSGFSYNDGWLVDKHPRMMAYVNDDNRADVVGFGAAGVWVATAKDTGDGFNSPSIWHTGFGSEVSAGSWQVDKHPRMMAYVNEDELADIVGFGGSGVWVATAKDTGDGFNSPTIWNTGFSYNEGWLVENHPRMMADVNGDNRADIVAFGTTGVWVSLSKEPNLFE